MLLLMLMFYKVKFSDEERNGKRDDDDEGANAVVSQDGMPVLALLSKKKVVEIVAPWVELDGIAEHHEQRKARTCNCHRYAVWVAVEDVRAEVFSENQVAGNTDREVYAECNAVRHTNDNVQSLPPVLRAKFIEHSEELFKKLCTNKARVCK